MTDFKDSWAQLRGIVDSTNKKQLMKKPNYAAAIQQISHLAEQMKDEELGGHAGFCHCEMAHLYNKLGEHNEERKQWEKAAVTFAAAEKDHLQSKRQVMCPFSSDTVACYTRAIKMLMDMKCLKMAGMTSLEVAKHCFEVKRYIEACEHATRASRLLEGERICYVDSLHLLARAQMHCGQIDQLLDTLDQLWIYAMKSWNTTPMGKEIQKEAEIATVLLCCNRKPRPGRHNVLKQIYSRPIAIEEGGNLIVPTESSLTVCHEFLSFQALVECLTRSEKHLAIQLYDKQCRKFFSNFCKELFLYLVDQL